MQVDTTANARRGRAIYALKRNLRIDMTPMVDLGFLLIAFFVMTSELSRPSVTKLIMPKEGGEQLLGMSNALSILLDEQDKAFYYEGEWKTANELNRIRPTNFSVRDGFGEIIRQKQLGLDRSGSKEGRKGLMLIIKPGPTSSYRSLMHAIDETLINNVGKYVIVNPDSEELKYLQSHNR